MECKFMIGQKVTRIFNNPWHMPDGITVAPDYITPKFGAIYTITSIHIVNDSKLPKSWSTVFLCFAEFPSIYQFDFQCFKPVNEHKTDISNLKKLLIPTVKEVRRVKEKTPV
jgi:hypothetical protein